MANDCPYVTPEALENLKNSIARKVISDINRDVIPEFREKLAQDIKQRIYKDAFAALGEETFSIGKKVFIRFIMLLGLAVIALTAWLGTK